MKGWAALLLLTSCATAPHQVRVSVAFDRAGETRVRAEGPADPGGGG